MITKGDRGSVRSADGVDPGGGRRPSCEDIWREVSKASFAVLSYATPEGEPRSSGVVYGTVGRGLFVAVAADG